MPESLNKLKRNTNPERLSSSRDVRFRHITTVKDIKRKEIREYIYETWTEIGSRYRTIIRPIDPSKIDLRSGNSNVLVSCTCGDFRYVWEYALKKRDNTRVKFSDGSPALIRNPNNINGVCKHILAIMNDVISKNKNDIILMKRGK